jgi:hypothetical protein
MLLDWPHGHKLTKRRVVAKQQLLQHSDVHSDAFQVFVFLCSVSKEQQWMIGCLNDPFWYDRTG